MGLPAEQLDYDPAAYYATKPVLEVFPGLGLDKMMKAAEKHAPRFWGIDTGLSIAPIPDDISHRILPFKKILQADPDIDSETYSLARSSSDSLRSIGEKALSNVVILQREKSIGKGKNKKVTSPHIRRSYTDILHHDPKIRDEVYETMLEERDSVAKTIATLEEWRLNQDEENAPNTRYLRLGIATFEIMLFAFRKDRSQEIISTEAKAKHKHIQYE